MCLVSVAQAQPAAPELVFPPNDTVFQNPGSEFEITLEWNIVEGADQYQVNGQIRNASGVFPIITITSNTEYTLPLTQNQIRGLTEIRWTVQSRASGQASQPSMTFRFVIDESGEPVPGFAPTPTPVPPLSLLFPPEQSIIQEDQLTSPVLFQWTAVPGASSYRFVIYLDNSPIQQRVLANTFLQIFLGFVPPLTKTYQWQVQALDDTGDIITQSSRSSFIIGGSGLFPTPTPIANAADHDGNGTIDARDLFFLAMRYRTNDPRVDYNQSGLNDPLDILVFVKRYMESSRP